MQSLRQPHWVFWVSTLPTLLLLAVCAGEFSVVRTLLLPESVALWQGYGAALLLLGLGGAAYAGWQWYRGEPLDAAYCVVMPLVFSAVLCYATAQSDELLPFSVPTWMVPTDPILMAWTLLMPTLAHGVLALVARFTPADQQKSITPNLLLMLVGPAGFLLVGALSDMLLSRMFGISNVVVAFLVLSTFSFFFFLVRALYIMLRRRDASWQGTSILLKVLLTIVLPVAGLLLNATMGNLFGDFAGPWVYGLAVLNGVLLCLPDSGRAGWRLAQLLGRAVLFGFTFYFAVVFLPFLPLSIPAILLIGMGFLLLAPTLLFVVHVQQLSLDVAALRRAYSRPVVGAVLGLGLLALPLGITARYWHERRVLHEALAYVYMPDYARSYQLDAAALTRTLATVRQRKERGRDFLPGNQLPYLSTYFNWLVLDNLMLSEAKLADLRHIFNGPDEYYSRAEEEEARLTPTNFATPALPAARLSRLSADSHYDARQQAWVSWLNLEITANSPQAVNEQYSTRIALPPGCWVGDYELTIEGRQEKGILSEKKAAEWVFAQILAASQVRDPGLLTYAGPNAVDLRVFPVTGTAARHTRIQLLHREPCVLTVDGREVAMGKAAAPAVNAAVSTPDTAVRYLSAAAKQRLPLVRRRPYFHFLLDNSAAQADPTAYDTRIKGLLDSQLPTQVPPRFSLVSTYARPLAAGADWQAALRRQPPAGGFFLSRAMRRVLFDSQQHPADTYPVLVVVSDRFAQAVLDEDFADFSSAYPEGEVFYVFGPDGTLEPHSLRQQSRQPLGAGLPTAAQAAVGPAAQAISASRLTEKPLPIPTPPAAGSEPAAGGGSGGGDATGKLPEPAGALFATLAEGYDSPAGLRAPPAVRAWPDAAHPRAYLPDNEQADIILTQPPTVPAVGAPSRWLSGLALRGYAQWQPFHPAAAERRRLAFVQASFRANILTPLTAFLALENEAQKAALRRKQKETLAANAALDVMESDSLPPVETPIDGAVGLLLAAGAALAAWRLWRR